MSIIYVSVRLAESGFHQIGIFYNVPIWRKQNIVDMGKNVKKPETISDHSVTNITFRGPEKSIVYNLMPCRLNY